MVERVESEVLIQPIANSGLAQREDAIGRGAAPRHRTPEQRAARGQRPARQAHDQPTQLRRRTFDLELDQIGPVDEADGADAHR